MRRLLLLLLITAVTFSTGCVAAVPLLIYAHRNKKHAAVEHPTPHTVRVVSHDEHFAPPPLKR